MILIVNLPSTDRFLANATTPILAPQRSLLASNSNSMVPERPVVEEGTDINGFILHNCMLQLRSFQVIDSPCGGKIYDQQMIMNDDIMSNQYSCIQMTNRVGNIAIFYDIEITPNNKTSFHT